MTKNAGVRLNTTARNIPDYNYTWTSPTFTILRKTESFIVLENASIPTTVRITDPLNMDHTSSTTSLPISTPTIVLMIGSFVALILLGNTIFCCAVMKRSNIGCFQKASAEPIVLFEANKRGRPGDRTQERLTPISDQVGMLPEDGASNHPATGDTYCKLNTLDFAQTCVYTAPVLAGESASVVPSYANILTLEMPLHKDIIPSMAPTSAALSNTAPTYENTVVVVHSIASTSYGNTVSTYENMIVSQ